MYKDLEKRREAVKKRVRRYRALRKGVTVVETQEKLAETFNLPVRPIPDALARSNAKFKRWKK